MISSEVKIVAGIGTVVFGMFIIHIYEEFQKQKRIMADKQRTREHELQLRETEVALPPEYWTAKAAEHEASVKKHEIDIQSQERLKIDQRNREDAERQAIREFEKDAPESYWQHKRFQEEELTKRKQLEIEDQRRRRLEEQERDITAKQVRSLEEGTKALEKALRTANYASTIFRY